MKRGGPTVGLVGLMLLGLALALEVAWLSRQPSRAVAAPQSEASPFATDAGRPASEPVPPTRFADATTRPLFEPDRRVSRLAPVAVPPAPRTAPQRAVRRALSPMPSLTAVLAGSTRTVALFRLPTGEVVVVGEGDSVSGWSVVAIDKASVRLKEGGQVRTLPLRPEPGAADSQLVSANRAPPSATVASSAPIPGRMRPPPLPLRAPSMPPSASPYPRPTPRQPSSQ